MNAMTREQHADPAGSRRQGAPTLRLQTPLVSMSGIAKRFGPVSVLRGVDLEIPRGQVTAIVGPNGSGKTTLGKMMIGLVKPDAGEVLFDGRVVNGDCDYRARIGYMAQAARLPENLTPREVLRLLTDLRRSAEPPDESLIAALGLEAEMQKPLRTLSGGTRQKVNAALAFLFRPELLVLDEPTAGLDPVASSTLKDRVLADRAAGRTFVLTSHIMAELEELSDRVVFLLDGTVRFAGALDELKRSTGEANLERAIALLMRKGTSP